MDAEDHLVVGLEDGAKRAARVISVLFFCEASAKRS
jgi:hypothetical protein